MRYVVMNTFDRMHWLATAPDCFDLYTDHNNLIFLFNPLTVVEDMFHSSLGRVF